MARNEIKTAIDFETLKAFYTKETLAELALFLETKHPEDPLPRNRRGNPSFKTMQEFGSYIIKHWDYELALKWTRDAFYKSDKYKEQAKAEEQLVLGKKHYIDKFGPHLSWGASQGRLDDVIQMINRNTPDYKERESLVAQAAIKNSYMSSMNNNRNDIIELMIINQLDNVFPSLKHSRSGDFYIDGQLFDQKVSRSVGREFKKSHKNYKKYARSHPKAIAKSLYENQDPGRFDDHNRLYVVFLYENADNWNIRDALSTFSTKKPPMNIKFKYDKQSYNSKSYVVLVN